MSKQILIIGGGISGIIAAANIKYKKPNYNVILVEKNNVLGGQLYIKDDNYWKCNNGPSWYWMDDIIQKVYKEIGIKKKDLYTIEQLNPQYTLFLDELNINVPNGLTEFRNLIKEFDPNCLDKFDAFIESNTLKYNLVTTLFLNYYNLSITEYFSIMLPYYVYKLDLFKSYRSTVNISTNKNVQTLMEWPSLFIGGGPKNISGLFSFLTYSMIVNGTNVPKNGMITIIEMLEKHLEVLDIEIITNEYLYYLNIKNDSVKEVTILNKEYYERKIKVDRIICACDYHYIETLLPNKYRSYPKEYWDNQVLCPSAIIFNVLLDIKLPELSFHNLFMETSIDGHFECIYTSKNMPEKPLFYINKYYDNNHNDKLFILIPANLNKDFDQPEINRIFNYILDDLGKQCNINMHNHILKYNQSTNVNFRYRFYAYKGNAYGLACDNYQIGFMRPKIKSRYVSNLYYCGQTTNPGPGIPTVMISGLLTSNLVLDELKNNKVTIFTKLYLFFINVWLFITNMIVMWKTVGLNIDWIKKEFNYVFLNKIYEYNSFNY